MAVRIETVPPRQVDSVADVADVADEHVSGLAGNGDLPGSPPRTDETIHAEVSALLHGYTDGRGHWRIEVSDGRVDVYGEPDDVHSACVLLNLVGTVAGVTAVGLYCGQATRYDAETG